MSESVLLAISFLILIVLCYNKLKRSLEDYLNDNVTMLMQKINDAEKINDQAMQLFLEAQKSLDQFLETKVHKIELAEQNSQKIRQDYIAQTQHHIHLKTQDFKHYLNSLQIAFFETAKHKVSKVAHSVILEAIKYEKFNISNKINS